MENTTTKTEVTAEIIELLQGGSQDALSDALQAKVTELTNEIAREQAQKAAGQPYSKWVITRDTGLIILSSFTAFEAQSKIKAALAKLSK
jgi:hypothetical protein